MTGARIPRIIVKKRPPLTAEPPFVVVIAESSDGIWYFTSRFYMDKNEPFVLFAFQDGDGYFTEVYHDYPSNVITKKITSEIEEEVKHSVDPGDLVFNLVTNDAKLYKLLKELKQKIIEKLSQQ